MTETYADPTKRIGPKRNKKIQNSARFSFFSAAPYLVFQSGSPQCEQDFALDEICILQTGQAGKIDANCLPRKKDVSETVI
jgi:hypothetical protein